MPALSVGDNVLVTFRGLLFNQQIISTFGYVLTEVTGAPDDLTVFNEINVAMSAALELKPLYNKCLPDQFDNKETWFQVIRPTRFLARKLPWLGGVVYSGFNAFAANSASVITRRGAIGNRRNVSTLHVPCPTDSDWLTAGTLTATAITRLNALCDAMKTTYVSTTGAVKFSPSILNGPLASDVTPIVECFPELEARVMRRRTVGLGK